MTAMPDSDSPLLVAFPSPVAHLRRLAHFWLYASLVMIATPGCVWGEYEYELPVRGVPQLSSPNPPTTKMIVWQPDENQFFPPLDFAAQLRSEDAGEDLRAVLLVNYGNLATNGITPWQGEVPRTIPASTLAAGPRLVALRYTRPGLATGVNECQRITMLVTHTASGDFPFQHCPCEEGDQDSITWFVSFCGVEVSECSFDGCAQEPEGGLTFCPRNLNEAFELNGYDPACPQ